MKAKRILKKLNYLPRWAWYLASLSIGGPVGALFAYLGFHALEKMAADEAEETRGSGLEWDVDIDADGVHVHKRGSVFGGRSARRDVGYQDEECTVTGEEDILSQWEETERSARSAQSFSAAQEDASHETDDSAGEIDEVIRNVDDAIARIRRANDLIPDEELSRQLSSIENSCAQILSILRQRPQLLPELRTFLRYYLPTTLKLLDARVRLDKNAGTHKAREVRQRISEALGVIDKAFLKQVEALDEYRFIDLESEMDVLRDMLRADGLVEEDKEDDPFASVMGGH